MLRKRSLSKALLIGAAVGALLSAAAFAAGPEDAATDAESTIAAVKDEDQLNDSLDAQHEVEQESTNEANHNAHEALNDTNDAQLEANEAKSDAQEAQQEANEATQEGGEHNSEHWGDSGTNSGP